MKKVVIDLASPVDIQVFLASRIELFALIMRLEWLPFLINGGNKFAKSRDKKNIQYSIDDSKIKASNAADLNFLT